ncbi:MAG TPA: shikimate dehydrogenase [Gemmatimonadales bacterium]
METGASTRLLAILGDPVAHSLSPAMHNAACRALGIDAQYLALHVPAPALGTVLQALAATGGAGNVTVPHKEAVERSVARKTDVCARAGACNTFWTEDGALVGDNTDVAGIGAALSALGQNGGKGGRWLVIGTGGSARAVAIAAVDAGAALWVRSRHPDRARQFAQWAAGAGARVEPAHGPTKVDAVINATPLGLAEGDPLPIDPKDLPGVRVALDLVYARGETRWVRMLRARGVAAADGRDVLVHQGAAAFSRFFPGFVAPVEVMRAAVERALRA